MSKLYPLGDLPRDQIDALYGTDGTPSDTNKYVTNSDGRLTLVTTVKDGIMAFADKIKLDAVPSNPVVTTRQVIAGNGLTGGGDLSADRTFDIALADATLVVTADSLKVGVIGDTNHGSLSGAALHAVASTTVNGFFAATDKTKLDGIAAGAEVNVNADWAASSGDAQILNRPSYGTIAASICEGNDSRLSDDRIASALRTATNTVTISGAAAPAIGQILTAITATTAAWQYPGNSQAPPQYVVSLSGQITTTLNTNVIVTGITYTPPAGTYLCFFVGCGYIATVATGNYVELSQFAGGVQNTASIVCGSDAPNYYTTWASIGINTVNGSQAIDMRWRRVGATNTATMNFVRTLTLLKIA
jgi:hypothetical protein